MKCGQLEQTVTSVNAIFVLFSLELMACLTCDEASGGVRSAAAARRASVVNKVIVNKPVAENTLDDRTKHTQWPSASNDKMRVTEVIIDGFKSYAVRTVISGWCVSMCALCTDRRLTCAKGRELQLHHRSEW